jgi:hypothetical protein
MRRPRPYPSAAALAVVLVLAAPQAVPEEAGSQTPPKVEPKAKEGTDPAAKVGAKPFKPEEIDGFVAPIALYPDEILPQILIASTYPLEVVEASRWVKANKSLKGDKLAVELEKKEWDPSVKSLVDVPQVLAMMDEKLEWTRKLGDAFLAQKEDVMAAIQRLRAKAVEQGSLKTTPEQKVTVEEEVVVIQSANPEVIYVPTYNPTVVYGTWPYPAYPPYYYYPPGYVAGPAISFGVGVAVGVAWGYAWGHCNWGHSDVDIDIDRNVNRNTQIDRSKYSGNSAGATSKGSWQHDPSHRKGASYRDTSTAQRYGGRAPTTSAQSREAYKGRVDSMRKDLSGVGTGQKAAGTSRPGQTAGASAARKSPSTTTRSGSSALGGYNRGSTVQAQSQRGSQSRQASPAARSSGGGGGRAAGGGGGRRR